MAKKLILRVKKKSVLTEQVQQTAPKTTEPKIETIYDKKPYMKIVDFILGLLLIWPVLGIITFVYTFVMQWFRFAGFFYFPLVVGTCVYAITLTKKRKYLQIGIITSVVLIPLLLLGTCLYILGSYR